MFTSTVKVGATSERETESVALPSEVTRNSQATLASDAGPPIEPREVVGPQLRNPERYHIIGEHGRGGLGRVSRAHDRELGRDVAIKELISRSAVDEVRFLREALITARLEHPGIVPVHEAGRWPDGTPFYAMKLVVGPPAARADRRAPDRRPAHRLAAPRDRRRRRDRLRPRPQHHPPRPQAGQRHRRRLRRDHRHRLGPRQGPHHCRRVDQRRAARVAQQRRRV